MNKQTLTLGICLLLIFGFLGFQTFRVANSLEYSEQQARKLQPIIDIAASQLGAFQSEQNNEGE